MCGGQVLTKEIHNKFEAKFSVPIFEGYGLTETTSFSCINRYPKNKRVFGSIGKELITNKMDILDTKTMTKNLMKKVKFVLKDTMLLVITSNYRLKILNLSRKVGLKVEISVGKINWKFFLWWKKRLFNYKRRRKYISIRN